jgi:hypothetical protein
MNTTTLPAPPARILTTRRVLLAATVAAAPTLQIIGMLWHPAVAEHGADQLAIVATDPGRWSGTHLVAAVASGLYVLAAVALAALVRARGAVLATLGAVLSVAGGITLAIAFGAESHLLSVAADPSLDRTAMAQLAELEHSSPAAALIMTGLPLIGLGQILLAAGLLRSRVIPRWQPALVLIGLVSSLAAAPGSLVGPVLMLPAVVGYVAISVGMARSAPRLPET